MENKDLSGLDLSGVALNGLNLSGANLSGVDLSGATLRNADLRNANPGRMFGWRSINGAHTHFGLLAAYSTLRDGLRICHVINGPNASVS